MKIPTAYSPALLLEMIKTADQNDGRITHQYWMLKLRVNLLSATEPWILMNDGIVVGQAGSCPFTGQLCCRYENSAKVHDWKLYPTKKQTGPCGCKAPSWKLWWGIRTETQTPPSCLFLILLDTSQDTCGLKEKAVCCCNNEFLFISMN